MSATIERAESRLAVVGDMTLSTASDLLSQGVSGLAAGAQEFDLSRVEDMDSSGLAVLFGWQRAAEAQGKPFRIYNPPQSLISLAEVYGVTSLLPLA